MRSTKIRRIESDCVPSEALLLADTKMKITQVKIQNFTSLVDVQLSNLPNLVVLIGKNSSGKSNLMDALTLFFTEFGAELERCLGDANDYQHLFPLNNIGVDPPPELRIVMSLRPREYDLIFGLKEGSWEELSALGEIYLTLTKRVTTIAQEVFWNTHEIALMRDDVWIEIVSDGMVSPSNYLPEILYEEPPEDLESWTLELMVRLADFLKANIQAIYTSESSRSWPDRFTERPTIVDDDHIRELWTLSQSRASQRRPWTEVTRQFEKLAPNDQRPVGIADSIQMQEDVSTYPVGMTGEGSQAMLRLIDRLVRSPQIITIEEPETHLHPALAKKAGRLLAETAYGGKQLFVCTHSPFLVDRSALDSFFIAKNEGNGTQISHMGNDNLKNLLLDLGVMPSDVLFCDAILLVEGLADETFFHILSNKTGVPLVDRHVKIIKANGKSRGKYKIEFWSEVGRDAGIPLYLILDSGAREEAGNAIAKDQLTADRCLLLPEGDLEDCYPWPELKQAVWNLYGKDIENPIPIGERVKQLWALLRRQEERNSWKPKLAEEVAQLITREKAESEMAATVGFLRKIFNELSSA